MWKLQFPVSAKDTKKKKRKKEKGTAKLETSELKKQHHIGSFWISHEHYSMCQSERSQKT